jgi:uncharacterized coiled-coil protein SlyX
MYLINKLSVLGAVFLAFSVGENSSKVSLEKDKSLTSTKQTISGSSSLEDYVYLVVQSEVRSYYENQQRELKRINASLSSLSKKIEESKETFSAKSLGDIKQELEGLKRSVEQYGKGKEGFATESRVNELIQKNTYNEQQIREIVRREISGYMISGRTYSTIEEKLRGLEIDFSSMKSSIYSLEQNVKELEREVKK